MHEFAYHNIIWMANANKCGVNEPTFKNIAIFLTSRY